MIAGALDLQRFPVQEESLVGVQANVRMPKLTCSASRALPSDFNGHHCGVQVRLFRRPQRGLRDIAARRKAHRSIRADRLRCASAVATVLPAGSRICQRTRQSQWTPSFTTMVLKFSLAVFPSICVLTLLSHVPGAAHRSWSATHAGKFPRLRRTSRRRNSHPCGPSIILPAVIEEIANVEVKGRVAVVVAPDEISVEKNQCAAERAVKLNRDAPSFIFFRNIEGRGDTSLRWSRDSVGPAACSRGMFCSSSCTNGNSTAQSCGRFRARHLESSNLAVANQNSPDLAKSPWPMPKPRSRSGSVACP